ncbi:hypothetical protein SAMN05216436_11868 [bacterium A37T11]|nr:hypothetical protein SAMN05216436_11868 [bacterium A37T11]
MKYFLSNSVKISKWNLILVGTLGVLLPLLISILTSKVSIMATLLLTVLAFSLLYFLFLINEPSIGIYSLLLLGFSMTALGREIGGINYGIFVEVILVLTWIVALFRYSKADWSFLGIDLTYLLFFWMIISVFELFNPSANFVGALGEFRTAALYPLLIAPICLVVFKKVNSLDTFLKVILIFSAISALNGYKQIHYGLFPGEQRFLDEGGAITHVLWGQLRVFSFYSDAGQFGASQAQMSVIALILAFGPIKWWKRLVYFGLFLLFFYGMLISGTRGALFVIVTGAAIAIFLTKNFKVMAVGGIILALFLSFLKFTSIGNGSYNIYRLRSALDPQDASLNVRFNSQKILGDYLSNKPFGDGLGTIGYYGIKYNGGSYLSSIQPDSYWVKVWAMYGTFGLAIWLGIMCYILGKCCGIVWNIKDTGLRIRLIALTAGLGGVFFCSYGNEVINNQPSSFIVYVSWALVFLGQHFDREISIKKILN